MNSTFEKSFTHESVRYDSFDYSNIYSVCMD